MQGTVLREGPIIPVIPTFKRMKGTEALTVPEILRAILDHAAHPTLASAARVSRAWLTVALDKLWSDYNVNVIDLIRILPSEIIDYEGYGGVWIPCCKLQRDPTDEEWIRLQSYASRIRSLSIPGRGITDRLRLDPPITEWKLKNDQLFPRLRRVEWYLPHKLVIPSFQLSCFTTSSMQELNLTIKRVRWSTTDEEVITSTLHDLTTLKGLRLKKFKFKAPPVGPDEGLAIADFISTQKDSLQTLELLAPCPRVSPLVGQSLGNLTALDIHIPRGGAEVANAIQALVEGCPRVAYLRMGITAGKFDLNIPGLRATLGWQLLSFDVWSAEWLHLSRAHIAEMARAWPKLKKFGLKRRVPMTERAIYSDDDAPASSRTPLSRLADIISEFSELEELGVEFFHDLNEDSTLPVSSHSSSPIRCGLGSRNVYLRLGRSILPKSKEEQDTMGVFMAVACPPGLRIQRSCLVPPLWRGYMGSNPYLEVEAVAVAGRDADPKWDALFQKIEELHGGTKVRVGSFPEVDDGVWF